MDGWMDVYFTLNIWSCAQVIDTFVPPSLSASICKWEHIRSDPLGMRTVCWLNGMFCYAEERSHLSQGLAIILETDRLTVGLLGVTRFSKASSGRPVETRRVLLCQHLFIKSTFVPLQKGTWLIPTGQNERKFTFECNLLVAVFQQNWVVSDSHHLGSCPSMSDVSNWPIKRHRFYKDPVISVQMRICRFTLLILHVYRGRVGR